MNRQSEDYLWDPQARPDASIEQLERALRPLSANALRLADRALPLPRPIPRLPRWRRIVPIAAAAAAMFATVYLVHMYRLSWPEGSPWPMTLVQERGTSHSSALALGERLVTSADQTATLKVARIGTVVIAPNSVAHLTRTRPGQHRIELEQGRLHARIWAPPSHFGVTHGEMRFTDLGCEFDLSVGTDGSGMLTVASGWVVYRHRSDEILVPEGYALAFDRMSARTPLRSDASPTFRNEVHELDSRLDANEPFDDPRVIALVDSLAVGARDDDYFTLLDLLVRHPRLAQGPLYPRLASALRVDVLDEAHRARWGSGDADAREEWWQRLPKSPKTWWLNWRDAF